MEEGGWKADNAFVTDINQSQPDEYHEYHPIIMKCAILKPNIACEELEYLFKV